MKAWLMYRDRDLDLDQPLPPNADALMQDLELRTLFTAMADDDTFLFDVASKALLSSLRDPAAIVYRQQVLADCLAQPARVRQMYDLAVEAIEAERKVWGFWAKSPDSILHRSVQVLETFVDILRRLRAVAEAAAGQATSEGFTRLCAMLARELDDDYFQTVEAHLRALSFKQGVLISADVGMGNKGTHYVLRRARDQSWIERLTTPGVTLGGPLGRSGTSFRIADRDEAGFAGLERLRGRGINGVANALAQSTDHILSFFRMLRVELAFYIGCLNLDARLLRIGEARCMPVPVAAAEQALEARGLYDVDLALHLGARVVGNDLRADHKALVMITGANQGGKSTFLRSVGVAQLMMQSGMFVPGEAFRASVCSAIFTHYTREEDPSMRSGKLDEELGRLSAIADLITPRALLLCNESFASTNEREGSAIARAVIRALVEAGIRIFFVTHLFDLAHGLFREEREDALFLRAERNPDGRRTYCITDGEPLTTSFGEDTFQRVFHPAPSSAQAAGGTNPA